MFETLNAMLVTAVFDSNYSRQQVLGSVDATRTELARLGVNLGVPDAAGVAVTPRDAAGLAQAAVAGQTFSSPAAKDAAMCAFNRLASLSTVQPATAWQPLSLASGLTAGTVTPKSRIIAANTVDLVGIIKPATDLLANSTVFTLATAPATPQTVTLGAQVSIQPPSLSVGTNGVCTTNTYLQALWPVVLDTRYGQPS